MLLVGKLKSASLHRLVKRTYAPSRVSRCYSSVPENTQVEAPLAPPTDTAINNVVNNENLTSLVTEPHPIFQDFISYKHLWEDKLGMWEELQAGLSFVLETIHGYTGLPWWVTISFAAVGLRAALLPITIKSAKLGVKMKEAAPEIELARSTFQEQMLTAQDEAEKKELVAELSKSLGAIYAKYHVSPVLVLKYTFFQIPFFVLFFFTIRNMCASVEYYPQLSQGGALWFTDLTIPDPYYALPFLCSMMTLMVFEIAMKAVKQQNQQQILLLVRIFSLGSFFIASTFPMGLDMYWLVSSLSVIASSLALQQNSVRRLVGLPPIQPVQKAFSLEESLKEIREARMKETIAKMAQHKEEEPEIREITEEELKEESKMADKKEKEKE